MSLHHLGSHLRKSVTHSLKTAAKLGGKLLSVQHRLERSAYGMAKASMRMADPVKLFQQDLKAARVYSGPVNGALDASVADAADRLQSGPLADDLSADAAARLSSYVSSAPDAAASGEVSAPTSDESTFTSISAAAESAANAAPSSRAPLTPSQMATLSRIEDPSQRAEQMLTWRADANEGLTPENRQLLASVRDPARRQQLAERMGAEPAAVAPGGVTNEDRAMLEQVSDPQQRNALLLQLHLRNKEGMTDENRRLLGSIGDPNQVRDVMRELQANDAAKAPARAPVLDALAARIANGETRSPEADALLNQISDPMTRLSHIRQFDENAERNAAVKPLTDAQTAQLASISGDSERARAEAEMRIANGETRSPPNDRLLNRVTDPILRLQLVDRMNANAPAAPQPPVKLLGSTFIRG